MAETTLGSILIKKPVRWVGTGTLYDTSLRIDSSLHQNVLHI